MKHQWFGCIPEKILMNIFKSIDSATYHWLLALIMLSAFLAPIQAAFSSSTQKGWCSTATASTGSVRSTQDAVLTDFNLIRAAESRPFTFKLRKTGTDLTDYQFNGCVRVTDKENVEHTIQNIQIEIVDTKNIGNGEVVLSMTVPEMNDEHRAFDLLKLATPVKLQIYAEPQDDNPNTTESFSAEYDYYLGSRIWSLGIALLITLFIYFCPLIFLAKTLGSTDQGWAKRISPLWLGRGHDGKASLSSFQVTIWTYLVFAITLYIFLLNGQLIDITPEILILLGISGGGAVMSRVVDSHEIERCSTILGAHQAVQSDHKVQPAWKDLLLSDGVIDLSRLQMLLFTLLTAIYVAITTAITYQFPEVPQGLLYLMGISNGLYLTAKSAGSSVADKLAGVDIKIRLTRKERLLWEGTEAELKRKLAEGEDEIRNLETIVSKEQNASIKNELKQKLQFRQEEQQKLREQLANADAKLTRIRNQATDLDQQFRAMVEKLNASLDQQADKANG